MISSSKVFFLSPLKIELSLVSFNLLNSSLWIHFRTNLFYTKTPLHILLLSLSFCTLTVHIAIFEGILFAAALTLRKFIKWPKRQPDRVLLIYIQIEKISLLFECSPTVVHGNKRTTFWAEDPVAWQLWRLELWQARTQAHLWKDPDKVDFGRYVIRSIFVWTF